MTQTRLNRIEIQGFRSFGKVRQALELPESISVLWGANSQGKTSFAEALEFLLTGQIARRELLSSTKDEFAEALRNAHIDPGLPVVVEAQILCRDGQVRRLTRTLITDYRKGTAAGCVSTLEIDGKRCTEPDVEKTLGLRLSQPPFRAPVLAQHTLGYLFSASPTDRAAYFRAILDTQDLEDFRTAVAALQPLLKPPILPELDDLKAVEAIPALTASAGWIRKAKTEAELPQHIGTNTSALLVKIGKPPGATVAEQANQIERELQHRQAQTFPIFLFSRVIFAPWGGPPATLKGVVETFLDERGKVDAKTKSLVDLFNAAIALPDHPTEHNPLDCPLCGAPDTFTVERVAFITERMRATATYAKATEGLQGALHSVEGQLEALGRSSGQAQPNFMSETAASRRAVGFRITGINKLLPDQAIIRAWFEAARRLWKAAHNLGVKIEAGRAEIRAALAKPEEWGRAVTLEESLANVSAAQTAFEACLGAYEAPAKALGEPLRAAVDQSTNTKGWEQLVSFSRDHGKLWKALKDDRAHTNKVTALEKALREIDVGNGRVLDEKFVELSAGVRAWWDRLRPDEPAFFDAVKRRSATARRTIDLKVGLSAKEDRSDAKIRDAIAVFSHSQLHCLGLSLFLARAVQEGAGFVILDDPVLTSDDDYRPNFASSVIEGLLDEGMQVIITTQDHSSWKAIGHLWEHRGAVQFQIIRDDPLLGTEIRGENDDLATMLAKARPFTKSKDPVLRKEGAQRIRDAIERFCKQMLVKDSQTKGDGLALITDFDGKNFGTYGQKVMDLLDKDPSHRGKLRAAYNYVTPGPHDDTPPSDGALKCAYGDLKMLKKEYLG